MNWPRTLAEADAILFNHLRHGGAEIVSPDDSRARMSATLETFLRDVTRGSTVLVKTSTAGLRSAEHEISASVLREILAVVRRCVADVRIVVGDGPAYSSYTDEAHALGYTAAVAEYGGEVADLNEDPHVVIAGGIPVSRTFLDAGAIVNLTRAKTHRRFGVSLGSKALLGAVSGSVLGRPKFPKSHNIVPSLLVELERLSPPAFTFIDGAPGIEGEGPTKGTVAASAFQVFGTSYRACDILASIQMGFDPALVPGFVTPSEEYSDGGEIDWSSYRKTFHDFLPARSCSWLYRSLPRRPSSSTDFESVTAGLRECWTELT